jgi:hypothetical protein
MEFWVNCFMVYDIDMHNNILFKETKPLSCQRGGDFIDGHCIISSIFFCLIIFYESQT